VAMAACQREKGCGDGDVAAVARALGRRDSDCAFCCVGCGQDKLWAGGGGCGVCRPRGDERLGAPSCFCSSGMPLGMGGFSSPPLVLCL
jgi:hypothetical protein